MSKPGTQTCPRTSSPARRVFLDILHGWSTPSSFPPRLFSHPLQYIKHLVLPYTAEERRRLTRASWFAQQGRGYFEEHATQPQTIGYALADSPTALLAWIYEKLVNWTDKYEWDDDEGAQQAERRRFPSFYRIDMTLGSQCSPGYRSIGSRVRVRRPLSASTTRPANRGNA